MVCRSSRRDDGARLSPRLSRPCPQRISVRILPVDHTAAQAYAAIAAPKGRPISQFDCQIAAIAGAQEATVATRNIGDYEGCWVDP